LTRCHVLMIPQGYELRLAKQMVFVFDQETNSDFLLSQLERLSLPLNAYVGTLFVENNGTAEAEHKIELLGEMLGVSEKQKFNWDFEPTYADDVVSSVDRYIKDSGTDILALSYHHRTLFEKLFKENVLKKISRIADYPVLVFWH